MKTIGVLDLKDDKHPINPETLFGSDTKKLSNACRNVMHDWLHPYEGCYRAKNPEDKAKEEASRKEWENQRDKQFRIVYGIAKRHGLYLRWHGNSCGDRWEIYKNHKPIGRIYC